MKRFLRNTIPYVVLAFGLCGCTKMEIGEVEYGKRVGQSVGRSVNGTTVFADMFESAGCRVRSVTTLGRVVDRADVVVWFPDRFRPPESDVREHLEDWLQSKQGRTLIYVGRDFDAEMIYWRSVIASAPADQRIELRKRLAKARARYARIRSGFPSEEDCGWFKVDRTKPTRQITTMSGSASKGIDPTKADMQLSTRYLVSDEIRDPKDKSWRGTAEMQTLLRSDGDMLVGELTRSSWQSSKLIVVANGSWLLNLPLVNHEHRKLGARIIQQCEAARQVVFLESGPGEPRIANRGPNRHHGLEAFTVWPLNCILMHLAGLGLVLCFSMFPIFGRPRDLDRSNVSDFGKHIRAIGALLSRTHDREFAVGRRTYYRKRVSGETIEDSDVPVAMAGTAGDGEPVSTANTPIPAADNIASPASPAPRNDQAEPPKQTGANPNETDSGSQTS